LNKITPVSQFKLKFELELGFELKFDWVFELFLILFEELLLRENRGRVVELKIIYDRDMKAFENVSSVWPCVP
jgi:hypothetical protein